MGRVRGSGYVDALTRCPLCGSGIDHIKTPAVVSDWSYGGPLIVHPCECEVPQEILRHPNSWVKVVDQSQTIGVKCGVEIRKEYSGDGLGPIAGDFDEVVVYDGVTPRSSEVARYSLEDVHLGVGGYAE